MALTLGTASVDPSGTFVNFPVTGATPPLKPSRNISGFILLVNGTEVTQNFADPEGPRGAVPASFNIAPSTPIASTDTVTYLVTGSNLTDSAATPNTLANVTTAVAVTNNSTLTTDAHDYSPIGDPNNENNVGLSDYVERTNDPNEGA